MSEIKTIECAAYDYQVTAADVSGGLAPYYVDAYLAGAKHQKELSDAREKLLLDVISEMKSALEFYKAHQNWFSNIKHKAGNCFSEINRIDFCYYDDGKLSIGGKTAANCLLSVAKKLEGL